MPKRSCSNNKIERGGEDSRDALRAAASQIHALIVNSRLGVAGLEAARVFAANGRQVEVWERKPEAGGQMDLALAAPDKEDVSGVWTLW